MGKKVQLVGRDEDDVWAAVEEEWVRVAVTEIADAGITCKVEDGGSVVLPWADISDILHISDHTFRPALRSFPDGWPFNYDSLVCIEEQLTGMSRKAKPVLDPQAHKMNDTCLARESLYRDTPSKFHIRLHRWIEQGPPGPPAVGGTENDQQQRDGR